MCDEYFHPKTLRAVSISEARSGSGGNPEMTGQFIQPSPQQVHLPMPLHRLPVQVLRLQVRGPFTQAAHVVADERGYEACNCLARLAVSVSGMMQKVRVRL